MSAAPSQENGPQPRMVTRPDGKRVLMVPPGYKMPTPQPPAPVLKDVPSDIAEELENAIENHSAATPAFDIIKSRYPADAPYTLQSKLVDGASVLTLACKQSRVDLITFLLNDMKADPNPPRYGPFGETALIELLDENQPENTLAGAKALARAGADPNALGHANKTVYTQVMGMFTGPYLRELLMAIATKDGTVTDLSTIAVPGGKVHDSWTSDDNEITVFLDKANPLHIALAKNNTVGALVMLELGVNPADKTSGMESYSCLELLKKFGKYDQALYDTIQAVLDTPAKAKQATNIYNGLVAAA